MEMGPSVNRHLKKNLPRGMNTGSPAVFELESCRESSRAFPLCHSCTGKEDEEETSNDEKCIKK